MYAGGIACCRSVRHVEYTPSSSKVGKKTPRTLLRLEKKDGIHGCTSE